MSGVPDSGTVYRFIPRFVTTQVAEISGNELIEIFPNPSGELMTIKIKESDFSFYNIVNAIGKIVKSGSIIDQNTTIDLSEFQSGVYTVMMSNGANTYSKSFIKK